MKKKNLLTRPQITYDSETGIYYFSLYPHKSTLNLDPYRRAVGRLGSIGSETKPEGQTVLDLGADLFSELYFPETEALKPEDLPEDRQLTSMILGWFREQLAYQAFQGETYQSIPAASAAAGVAWQFLTQDEVIRKILELQEQLSKLLEQYGDGEGEGQEGGYNHSPAQQAGEEELAKVRAKIAKLLKKLDDSPFAKAMLQAKVGKAAQEAVQAGEAARDLAESIGWGNEAGEVKEQSLSEILAFMKKNQRFLSALVKAIGRAKRTALRAAAFVAPTFQPIATGDFTDDLLNIHPQELAMLVDEDEGLAAMGMLELYDRGLFGWTQKSDRKEDGYFTAAADVSGSIGHEEFILTTGTLLGLARAAREKKREYSLYKFDTQIQAHVHSSEDWQKHLRWTAAYSGGGTNFDPPLAKMAEDIEKALATRHGDHRGMDAVILSDGEASYSDKTLKRWEALKKQGVRLLYIAVGTGTGVLNKLANKTLELHQMNLENADEVAATVGKWLAD